MPPTSLAQEIASVWRSLPQRGMFLALLGAWLALFHFLGNSTFGYVDSPSILGYLEYAYRKNPTDQMGYFMPFVLLVVLWLKRDRLLPAMGAPSWAALALVSLGLVLHFTGFVVQQTRISLLGFIVGLYGLTGVVWGLRLMRSLAFPFFLLLFCIPLGTYGDVITFPLRMLVAKLSVGTANLLGIDVVRTGSQIFAPDLRFQYDVAPACSGIRSLVTLTSLTLVYAYLNFESWWRRGLVVLLAAPLAVLGNTLRILCVIIAGEVAGQDAGATIEQNLGFLTFAVALAALLFVGHWLRETPPTTPKTEGTA